MENQTFKAYASFQNPVYSDFDRTVSTFNSLLGNIQTALPCQVVAVSTTGNGITGFVDVKIMVNQTDGTGEAVENAVINSVPYLRTQGGANAIICDPQIGDFGVAIFASRDISKFNQARTQSNPASFRQFSLSDAMYFGGLRNQAPTQYVYFTGNSIEIVSPNKVHVNAPSVVVDASTCTINAETTNNGNVKIKGNLDVSGNVLIGGLIGQTGEGGGGGSVSLIGPVRVINDLTAEGKSLAHHTHTCPDGETSEPH